MNQITNNNLLSKLTKTFLFILIGIYFSSCIDLVHGRKETNELIFIPITATEKSKIAKQNICCKNGDVVIKTGFDSIPQILYNNQYFNDTPLLSQHFVTILKNDSAFVYETSIFDTSVVIEAYYEIINDVQAKPINIKELNTSGKERIGTNYKYYFLQNDSCK